MSKQNVLFFVFIDRMQTNTGKEGRWLVRDLEFGNAPPILPHITSKHYVKNMAITWPKQKPDLKPEKGY